MVIIQEKQTQKKSGGCGLGAVIGIVVFIVVIGAFAVGIVLYSTDAFEDTRDIVGEASAYDPIEAYPSVVDYAGEGALLMNFTARYVRSDGTLDLTADYLAGADFEFLRPKQTENDKPLGVPGASQGNPFESVNIRIWQPGQLRQVTTGDTSYTYLHRGMQRDIRPYVGTTEPNFAPTPICSFADLWGTALEVADAPPAAVAIIRYDYKGYQFLISDTSVSLSFDTECKLIR